MSSFPSKDWVKEKIKDMIMAPIRLLLDLSVFVFRAAVEVAQGAIEWAFDVIIGLLNEYVQPAYDYVIGHNYFATIHLVFCHKLDKVMSIDVDEYNLVSPAGQYAYPVGDLVCEVIPSTSFYKQGITEDRTDYSNCMQPTELANYPGTIANDTTLRVYELEAFGGIDSTGGMNGNIDVLFGQSPNTVTTTALSWLREAIKEDDANDPKEYPSFVSSYKGMFSLLLRGVNTIGDGMNFAYNSTQLKPITVLGTRVMTRYEELLTVDGEAARASAYRVPSTFIYRTRNGNVTCDNLNPIYILLDCLLDSDWGGLGFQLPTYVGGVTPYDSLDGDITETQFNTVAGLLHAEGFGLSMLWKSQESIEDFIVRILGHINAILYVDPETGRFTISLIRPGASSAGTLDESNILSLENYEIKSTPENINKLTVNYTNYDNPDNIGSVTVDSLASIRTRSASTVSIAEQSEIKETSRDYWGITEPELALKVATRDLMMLSIPLSKVTLLINRTMQHLVPGDTFVFSWDALGITSLTMRVLSVDIGSSDNSVMRIDAIADVFSFGDAVVTEAPYTEWTDPSTAPPQNIDVALITELETSYVEAYNKVDAFDNSKCYTSHSCIRPNIYYVSYMLLDKLDTDATYTNNGTHPFADTYSVIVDAPIIEEATTTITTAESISTVITTLLTQSPKVLGFIGNEMVVLTAVNTATELVVSRGAGDTVVESHSAGTQLTFVDITQNNFGNVVSPLGLNSGEVYDYKLLPINRVATLSADACTAHTVPMTGRIQKPYPPGYVLINDNTYPATSPLKAVVDDIMYQAAYPWTINSISFTVDEFAESSSIDFRVIIPKEKFDFTGFADVKLQLKGASNTIITACHIGLNADPTTNLYDFHAAPTPVLFDGGITYSILDPANITSDAVTFTIDGTRDVLVSFTLKYVVSTAGYGSQYGFSYGRYNADGDASTENSYVYVEDALGAAPLEGPTGITYQKAAADEAGTTVASSGYTKTDATIGLNLIRVGDVATNNYTRISWAHRDRISQAGTLVGQDDPLDYGPEAGVTYTLRLYNGGSTTPLRTLSGLTGKFYDYTETNEIADNGTLCTQLRIELESIRGADISRHHDITITRP